MTRQYFWRQAYPGARLFHRTGLIALLLVLFTFAARAQKPMPRFHACFKTLYENGIDYEEFEDNIHRDVSEERWIKLTAMRAARHREKFPQNNAAIQELSDYFKQDASLIPDVAYDSLLFHLNRLFQYNLVDNFLAEEFTQYLLPHYQARTDTMRLMLTQHISGYSKTEIARLGDEECGRQAKEAFFRNIQLADSFDILSSEAPPIAIPDYINYCYTLSALGVVSPSEALDGFQRFQAYVKRNWEKMSASDRRMCDIYMDRISSTFVRIHNGNKFKTHNDSIARAKMQEVALAETSDPTQLRSVPDSIEYFYNEYIIHRKQPAEVLPAMQRLVRGVFEEVDQQDSVRVVDVQYLGNIFTSVVDMMADDPQGDFDQNQLYVSDLCKMLVRAVQRTYLDNTKAYLLENMVGKLACNKNIFKFLPADVKSIFMAELAVKSQLGTVVHVTSVARLSGVVLNALLDKCPEQFIGIMGMKSVKELQDNRDKLVHWIETAAEYHDLGKNGMSPIITNEFRNLTAHEYAIMRRHPELALEYLNTDTLFYQYQDIALGHHKWYDGKGGYPESFDNLSSPWRAFIDLVTICDCIDAATETYYRNYTTPKSLKDLLKEFKQQAGTRYNPVMIKAIMRNKKLCEEIERIITVEREDRSRQVRRRYVK